ncbi:MAG TPA: helix-turn-helix transcriptional regulator [Candidatus Sulfomarinibacteraceae bacterium]|nr:helix-turn-helix transcriptional regulator [Candidatus Sulfomarinibacteraceae bacterium]
MKNSVSLPEMDYSEILNIIAKAMSLQTSGSLAELFRIRLLPLLGAGACFFAWGVPEVLRPRIIDGVGIHRTDFGTIQDYFPSCPLARHMVAKKSVVEAYDLDVPRRELHESIERFFKANRAGDAHARSLLHRVNTVLLAIDGGEPEVVIALHRLDDSREPFTLREKRILEHLGPHLGRAVRALPRGAGSRRQTALADEDAPHPRPLAVHVTGDSKIVDQNPGFRELFDSRPGDTLSASLTRALARGIDSFERALDNSPSEPDASWLCHCPSLYRVDVRRRDDHLWLMELHPSSGACPCFNPKLKQFGLTPKESEICCRVRQGYGNQEIASQLSMSLHTAKTHLKNIYKKLNISNRARLVSFLNSR